MPDSKTITFGYEELLRLDAALSFRIEFYQKRVNAIQTIREQLDNADELEAETKDELYRYKTLYDKIRYYIQKALVCDSNEDEKEES